ncbi:MAG: epoxide hydrolase, partial [Acidobacteria bacterium]|nr:epoxide hydrolase [Acidobacteriota bacterium]
MLKRFQIGIPDESLNDLRARLRAARWPLGVTDSGGVSLEEMGSLVRYWVEEFDWRAQE